MGEWLSDHARQIGIGAFVVFAGYFVMLPMFWPKPEVTADIPDTVLLGEDLPITVTVTAWHGLFDVNNVRFYIDTYGSSAQAGDQPLYPLQLMTESPTRYQWGDRFKRITIPHTLEMEFTVPLAQTAADGLLGPGLLNGKLDVGLTYESGRTRWVDTRNAMQSVPFSINVQ
ncbi:MAG: hypothetical protein GY851_23120 [bacterium]|nr:hypothetical protein [bacterium]